MGWVEERGFIGKVRVKGHEDAQRRKEEGTHLVCLIIHAIFCADIALAAAMRSPSFSRPSSSMTTRNSPRANAASASSIGSNANVARTGAGLTSCGRAGEAVAGTRGKSIDPVSMGVGMLELGGAPFILDGGRGEEGAGGADDSGGMVSATGAMAAVDDVGEVTVKTGERLG